MIISVIACPNGMGHFYRLLDISKVIAEKNIIYFFCSKNQLKKINSKFKNIFFIPIIKNAKIDEKNFEFLIKFYHKDLSTIQEINDSDIIISDNLINKIYTKKKFLLISNFFWGNNFSSKSKKNKIYLKIEKNYLKQNKVLQNKYFGHSLDYKLNKLNFNFTGKKKKNKKIKRNKIFFYFRKNIKIFPMIKVLQSKFEIYSNKSFPKYNIKYFNLNKGLSEFKFLLARPGMGSITDSIKFNVPILSYMDKNDCIEMHKNNKLIKKYKIGFVLNKEEKDINELLFLKKNKYIELIKNLNKFRFDGEKQILNYVKNL